MKVTILSSNNISISKLYLDFLLCVVQFEIVELNFSIHCLFIIFFENFSKDVRLPVQLQRAMAAEAEAAREARAKVIAAEGEEKSSKALKEASDVMTQSPAALQLRYLQVSRTPWQSVLESVI